MDKKLHEALSRLLEKYVPEDELIAEGVKFSDGHFTLLKFSTNYRAGFRTPMPDDYHGNARVNQLIAEGYRNFFVAPTRKAAIITAFLHLPDLNEPSIDDPSDVEGYRNYRPKPG